MSTELLLRRVVRATKRRFTNFGVELECLPTDSGESRDEYDDEPEFEYHCPDCERYVDRDGYHGQTGYRETTGVHTAGLCRCLCWDCMERRAGEWQDAYDNWEPDSSNGPDNLVATYISEFVRAGVTDDAGQCEYHCCCPRCRYDRAAPHFTAQRDCTVGVEFVSRILNCDRDINVLDMVVEAHEAGMKATGWRPDGSYNNGNHIHVSQHGTDNGDGRLSATTRLQIQGLIESLFAVGTWDRVARGGCAYLRDYNGSKPEKNGRNRWGEPMGTDSSVLTFEHSSSWLSDKQNTLEFRLWNTPRIADRIKAHVGLSLGIIRWAATQCITQRETLATWKFPQFEELMSKRLDDVKEIILDAVPEPLRHQSAIALEDLRPS